MNKEILLSNIDKIHTSKMGIDRIQNNLNLNTTEIVKYCQNKILDKNSNIYNKGKDGIYELKEYKENSIPNNLKEKTKVNYDSDYYKDQLYNYSN